MAASEDRDEEIGNRGRRKTFPHPHSTTPLSAHGRTVILFLFFTVLPCTVPGVSLC